MKEKIIKYCKEIYELQQFIIQLLGLILACIVSMWGIGYIMNGNILVKPAILDLSGMVTSPLLLYTCFGIVIIETISLPILIIRLAKKIRGKFG